MKITALCMSLAFSLGIQDANSAIRVKNLGNENNFVYINPEKKYLLIPVEDSAFSSSDFAGIQEPIEFLAKKSMNTQNNV